MNDDLEKILTDVVLCINNAEEEQAIFILLMSLKKYDADVWQKQIWNLLYLKERISNIPSDKRRIVHSLLEQTIMACIAKSLCADIKLSLNDYKKFLDSQPDYPCYINAQEVLKYRIGCMAFRLAKITESSNKPQDALFFLTHAQFRNTPLNAKETLLADKIQRENQTSTSFVENLNG